MRKFHAILLGGLAVGAASGVALAAGGHSHVMTVPLPDGAVAHISYEGDVAPRVTVDPVDAIPVGLAGPIAPGWFGGFDRLFADLDRQAEVMASAVAGPPTMPGGIANVAAYGQMPAGSSSYTMVSTNRGGHSCTRTTQVTSDGPGKPPRVVTNASGDCAAAAQPPARGARPSAAAPTATAAPLDRT